MTQGYKTIYLHRESEEGAHASFNLNVSSLGFIGKATLTLYTKEQNKRRSDILYQTGKPGIRQKDISFCYRHIPSSIMWKVEVHHDWKNGGVMYLLSPEEHRLRTRLDRWQKNRR